MKLRALLENVDVDYDYLGELDKEIESIEIDSRKVKSGSLFVAVPGFEQDGKKFVSQAIANGAVAIVQDEEFFDNLAVTQIRVSGVRDFLSSISSSFYEKPSQKLFVCGITGTNGKTTVTQILKNVWEDQKIQAASIGTLGAFWNQEKVDLINTTPESRVLQELLCEMKSDQISHVSMEVSSHALFMQRVRDIHFDVTIFTHLSRDHLDFHEDMESYFQSKLKLFDEVLMRSSKKEKLAIICGDSNWGEKIIEILSNRLAVQTFGLKKQNHYYPIHFKSDLQKTEASLKTPEGILEIEYPLIGKYNLLNVLAALPVFIKNGFTFTQIQKSLKNLKQVPGRLEKIKNPNGKTIIVDYAHTPDAMLNVLETVKSLVKGKIITVFGCGGNRDVGKRKPMGEMAAFHSDICIVTSDNPRFENLDQINQEILSGILKIGMTKLNKSKGYLIETDRKKAIYKALDLCELEDLVLILGKGHEDYQIIQGEKFYFSDKKVVEEYFS